MLPLNRLATAIIAKGISAVVTLSGETINFSNFAASALCSIHIRTDGTIDKTQGPSTTQIDASTDWIIPNAAAATDYEFRVTSVTHSGTDPGGLNWSSSPGADGSWFDLSGGDLMWSIQRSPADNGTHTVDFTLEVRKNGGATLASTAYQMNATVFGV